MAEKAVRKMSADEMLDSFHNIHLEKLTSSLINHKVYSSMAPTDTAFVQQLTPDSTRKVDAATARELEEKNIESQTRILKAIEVVREDNIGQLKF